MPPASSTAPMAALSMISPATLLLIAGGVALASVSGLPWWGVVLVGAGTWSVKVLISTRLARFARNRPQQVDPFALREPWRLFVMDAIDSQRRFRRALKSVEQGPLHNRLAEIGARVDRGVTECWEVARKGQQLADARHAIDVDSARRTVSKPESPSVLIEAAQSQIGAHQRLADREGDIEASLRALDARLDEAVARAAEMSTRSMGAHDVASISDVIDGVVGDLEALRLGLNSVDGAQ